MKFAIFVTLLFFSAHLAAEGSLSPLDAKQAEVYLNLLKVGCSVDADTNVSVDCSGQVKPDTFI